MSDLVTAIGMSLMYGKEPKFLIPTLIPFPELLQDLEDYVNSEEYKQLIIKEQIKNFKNKN